MDPIFYVLGAVIILFIVIFVLKSLNGKEKLSDKKISHYTMYYTTWCPACKNMKPVWDTVTTELTQSCADDTSQTECPEYKEKDETENPTEGIERIPTILRHYEDGTTDQYAGGRDQDRLRAFLTNTPTPA
jgi:thiol-disulfide isomerase/thioredoxin